MVLPALPVSEPLPLDAVSVVRSFFLAGIFAGLLMYSSPWLTRNLLSYGTRAQEATDAKPVSTDNIGKGSKPGSTGSKPATGPIEVIRAGVPHSWFVHYYILIVALTIFWGIQILSKGAAFLFVSKYVNTSDLAPSMGPHQAMLVWLLMLVQGVRRLLETIAFTKPSASRMPWSIYAIGIAYYLVMSIAVWIEGSKALLHTPAPDLALPAWPSIRSTLGLILFSLASGIQHDCHAYLADLPKYTLPEHPSFRSIICPHYTAELVLYAALAFIAAPPGHMVNGTLMCNVLWVLVNLGVVADGSKRWSEQKFGKEKVAGRARMIPGIW